MPRTPLRFLAFAALFSAFACEQTVVGPPAEPETDPHQNVFVFEPVGCEPTSDSVRTTIFEPACGGLCHGADHPALGLDLTSMPAESLVGRTSADCVGRALVVPGSPELSFLYEKVTSPTPTCGDRMPIDSLLSDAGQTCLANWIASLAPAGGCEKCGGDVCVVLAADTNNCGECGNVCEAGLACVNGACGCSGGGMLCDAVCVDTKTDTANCGTCESVCAAGAACRDGECTCPAPLIACGGTCVDPDTNASHCGECDNACPSGSACTGGSCDCSAPLTSCDDTCVDVSSDPEHCGNCATTCASDQVCLLSSCSSGCGSLTQCGGSCVDTDTSPLHCGTCDSPCAAGLECNGGRCQCPGGRTACGSTCVDTSTDPTNCGECGRACGPSDSCTAGSCSCDASKAVSFSGVIAPLFAAGCTSSGCHAGAKPKEGLLLTATEAYDELVGVSSGQCSGRLLVDPGSPSTSYLLNKLLGVGMCSGTAMPKAEQRLAPSEIDGISAWICAGAPRN